MVARSVEPLELARSARSSPGGNARPRLTPRKLRKWVRPGIAAGGMVALAALYLVPFYFMVLRTFILSPNLSYPPDFNPFDGTSFANLEYNVNFVWSYAAGFFAQSFFNSLFVAAAVTAMSVLVSSLAGYAFARLTFPGRDLLFYVVLATLMIPFPTTFIGQYTLMYDLGWLNTYQGLVFPQLASGVSIFLMRQYFTTIPSDIENAAKVDGLRPWQIFFRIAAPLAKPAFAAVTIFTFLGTWNNYLWPLIVSHDIHFYTVPLVLNFFKGANGQQIYWNQMMTATLLMTLPTLCVYIFAERYFIQGIAMTAVKG